MNDITIKYMRLIERKEIRVNRGKIIHSKMMVLSEMTSSLTFSFIINPDILFPIKFIALLNITTVENNVMINVLYNNLGIMKTINKLLMNNKRKGNKYAMKHNCMMRNISECKFILEKKMGCREPCAYICKGLCILRRYLHNRVFLSNNNVVPNFLNLN